MWLRILTWDVILGNPMQSITAVLVRGTRQRCKVEAEVAVIRGHELRQGSGFLATHSRGNTALRHLDFSPLRLILDFCTPELDENKFVLL